MSNFLKDIQILSNQSKNRRYSVPCVSVNTLQSKFTKGRDLNVQSRQSKRPNTNTMREVNNIKSHIYFKKIKYYIFYSANSKLINFCYVIILF